MSLYRSTTVHFIATVITERYRETPCWKSNPLIRVATKSSRNGNEAVAVAVSEAFARWLYHQYALVELPSAGRIVLPRDILSRYTSCYCTVVCADVDIVVAIC